MLPKIAGRLPKKYAFIAVLVDESNRGRSICINRFFFIENKEIISLFAQTGIWRNELLTPDVDDVDLVKMRI